MPFESWLEGAVTLGMTLLPFLLAWAGLVLWRRSGSRWAAVVAAGAAVAVGATVLRWVGFFIHYSSVQTMMAENNDPGNALRQMLVLSGFFAGIFIAAFGLVGYARSLPEKRP